MADFFQFIYQVIQEASVLQARKSSKLSRFTAWRKNSKSSDNSGKIGELLPDVQSRAARALRAETLTLTTSQLIQLLASLTVEEITKQRKNSATRKRSCSAVASQQEFKTSDVKPPFQPAAGELAAKPAEDRTHSIKQHPEQQEPKVQSASERQAQAKPRSEKEPTIKSSKEQSSGRKDSKSQKEHEDKVKQKALGTEPAGESKEREQPPPKLPKDKDITTPAKAPFDSGMQSNAGWNVQQAKATSGQTAKRSHSRDYGLVPPEQNESKQASPDKHQQQSARSAGSMPAKGEKTHEQTPEESHAQTSKGAALVSSDPKPTTSETHGVEGSTEPQVPLAKRIQSFTKPQPDQPDKPKEHSHQTPSKTKLPVHKTPPPALITTVHAQSTKQKQSLRDTKTTSEHQHKPITTKQGKTTATKTEHPSHDTKVSEQVDAKHTKPTTKAEQEKTASISRPPKKPQDIKRTKSEPKVPLDRADKAETTGSRDATSPAQKSSKRSSWKEGKSVKKTASLVLRSNKEKADTGEKSSDKKKPNSGEGKKTDTDQLKVPAGSPSTSKLGKQTRKSSREKVKDGKVPSPSAERPERKSSKKLDHGRKFSPQTQEKAPSGREGAPAKHDKQGGLTSTEQLIKRDKPDSKEPESIAKTDRGVTEISADPTRPLLGADKADTGTARKDTPAHGGISDNDIYPTDIPTMGGEFGEEAGEEVPKADADDDAIEELLRLPESSPSSKAKEDTVVKRTRVINVVRTSTMDLTKGWEAKTSGTAVATTGKRPKFVPPKRKIPEPSPPGELTVPAAPSKGGRTYAPTPSPTPYEVAHVHFSQDDLMPKKTKSRSPDKGPAEAQAHGMLNVPDAAAASRPKRRAQQVLVIKGAGLEEVSQVISEADNAISVKSEDFDEHGTYTKSIMKKQ